MLNGELDTLELSFPPPPAQQEAGEACGPGLAALALTVDHSPGSP